MIGPQTRSIGYFDLTIAVPSIPWYWTSKACSISCIVKGAGDTPIHPMIDRAFSFTGWGCWLMRERMRPYLHSQGREHQMTLGTHASSIVSGRILRSSKISSGSRNSMVSSTILAYKNIPRMRVNSMSGAQSFSYLSTCQLMA
jgi:hypothetical protein